MKKCGRSFQKSDIISEDIIQISSVYQQKLINLSNGKKLVIQEDCKFRQMNNSQNQKEIYIKLKKSSYQICQFNEDFTKIKILRTQNFGKLNYDQTCSDLQTNNGLILVLQFNQMLILRNHKIIQKIKPQSLRILNQKTLQQLPYLIQPKDENNKLWNIMYDQIIDKFKQYFKINKEPPQIDYQIKAHNDIFVLKRFANDQFLYLAEFSYLQNKQGIIKKIIIYENDLFLDLTIIQGVIVILIYRNYQFRLYKIQDEFILVNQLIYTHQDSNFLNAQLYQKWLILNGKEVKRIEIII